MKNIGSTFYVTLEPCHHHGRTPPCDKELVRRGAARVVVAVVDPDYRVNGEGNKYLQDNGITLTVGVCNDQAQDSLRSYLHHRKTHKPLVILKIAMSLDGSIACEDGSSKWITGPAARKHAHDLRARSQAILVGSGTALIDNPNLTVRDAPVITTPLRVVLDSLGRVLTGNLMDTSQSPTLIYTSDKAPQTSLETWKKAGVEYKIIRHDERGLILEDILADLGTRGILQLLVEGGGKLQSNFIIQDLVDSLVIYRGSCMIGNNGKPWARGDFASTMEKVKFWKLHNLTQLENDVYAEYTKQ